MDALRFGVRAFVAIFPIVNPFSAAIKLVEATDPDTAIDGQYIVVLDSAANVSSKAALYFTPDQIKYKYDAPFKGLSVQNLTNHVLEQLQQDSQVLFVEQVLYPGRQTSRQL